MSEEKPLLTIVHASDLHIGQIDPATGNAEYAPAVTALVSNLTWFDGVLGHHGRGLEHLEAFLANRRNSGESPLVLVSGDLTRVGGDAEFDNAVDYLVSQIDLHPPFGNYVGLRYAQWQDHAIPGNHDRWPGKATIFGGPGAAFGAFFPPASFPYVRPDILLSNGRELQFLGIDTDCDVSPHGLKRLRAVGSFQSQLATLGGRIRTKRPQQIRALVMHHSWHKRGPLLSIDRGSRAALDQFLFDYEVQVMLTGHTHEPLVQKFVPAIKGAQPVLEGRSGTTTQNDQVAYNWRTVLGTFPSRKWPRNSLLVHQLYEDDAHRTVWRAETFTRTRSGFVSLGQTGIETLQV